ncbi:MAG: hypothetical protein U0Q07_07870 [Acidimicrobiales bacterium]
MTGPRLVGDAGQAGGIEMLPFGLLVFVVGGLVVAGGWAVVDGKLAVSAASEAAVRTYVEAPDPTTAEASARRAAADAARGLGRDPERLTVAFETEGWRRCGRVRVRAAYTVPALVLPWVGGRGSGTTVRSTRTEVIDPYRSGLAGEARCAG